MLADLVESLASNSSRVAVLERHTAVVRSHQNDSAGSTCRDFSQVCSAIGGTLSSLPPYPVALEGCLDISIHVSLVTLCHDHYSPADDALHLIRTTQGIVMPLGVSEASWMCGPSRKSQKGCSEEQELPYLCYGLMSLSRMTKIAQNQTADKDTL